MKIVVATNTLRTIGVVQTFVLNLPQGTVPDRCGETGAAAM
jgi:hypothetical protein